MNTNYYLTLPITIVSDVKLAPFEKILLAHIHSLSKNYDYCYANNHYFAKVHNVTKRTITKYLSLLDKKGYIKCEYIKTESNNTKRKIYITNKEVWNARSGGIENSSDNSIEETLYQNKESKNKKYNNYANKKMVKESIVPDWLEHPEMCVSKPATPEEIAYMEELLAPFKNEE